MKLLSALKLGRVSNLPTVWSNTLAGLVLAQVDFSLINFFVVALAMSLIYSAGMFFNDVFDSKFDARNRPDRPIPAGEVERSQVVFWASLMILLALILIAPGFTSPMMINVYALTSALLLCALVLLYDWRHKGNVFAPFIMGACRGLVYITAALTLTSQLSSQMILAASCITIWVVGLTLVAKQQPRRGCVLLIAAINLLLFIPHENASGSMALFSLSVLSLIVIVWVVFFRDWGKFYNPVTLLIAGISLLDALVVFRSAGELNMLVMAAVGLFILTLLSQRLIEGS
jgi:4-hydroxybenzoate polyprenyltransferase